MPAIIRTLWGDDTCEHSRWPKIAVSDVPRGCAHNAAPQWVYVYGQNNADLLTKLGQKNVVLIDADPWPGGYKDCQRGRVYCLDTDTLWLAYETDYNWIDQDGSVLHRIPDQDAFQAAMDRHPAGKGRGHLALVVSR